MHLRAGCSARVGLTASPCYRANGEAATGVQPKRQANLKREYAWKHPTANQPPKLKVTVTVVSTSVGSPLSRYGLYRHCRTASTALERNISGPLIT